MQTLTKRNWPNCIDKARSVRKARSDTPSLGLALSQQSWERQQKAVLSGINL